MIIIKSKCENNRESFSALPIFVALVTLEISYSIKQLLTYSKQLGTFTWFKVYFIQGQYSFKANAKILG